MDAASDADEPEDSGPGDLTPKPKAKAKAKPKAKAKAKGKAKGKPAPQAAPKAKTKAAPAPVPVRGPLHGLPPCFESMSAQTVGGLRAGACLALRAHCASLGTVLRSGAPPALTPLPGASPSSVPLTAHGVLPLLERAAHMESQRLGVAVPTGGPGGPVRPVPQLRTLVDQLRANPAAAAALGTTPLFNLAHPPLQALLAKHNTATVPGEPLYTGGGLRVVFPVVRYQRRVERIGETVAPGRLFNWSLKGRSWLRRASARGKNGSGLRTLSRDWKGWACWTPGPYHPEGVPKRWRPWHDTASCVVIDPGVILPIVTSRGLALSKRQWYKLRGVWADFVPTPHGVATAEASVGKGGRRRQAPGLVAFSRYLRAFHEAYGRTEQYYVSRAQTGAREHKQDKLRSLLAQLLHALAPRPQVGERSLPMLPPLDPCSPGHLLHLFPLPLLPPLAASPCCLPLQLP